MKIGKWEYGRVRIASRIPDEIGFIWSKCIGVTLNPFECVGVTSNLDGTHMGKGTGPELCLAKDESDDYLLIHNDQDRIEFSREA